MLEKLTLLINQFHFEASNPQIEQRIAQLKEYQSLLKTIVLDIQALHNTYQNDIDTLEAQKATLMNDIAKLESEHVSKMADHTIAVEAKKAELGRHTQAIESASEKGLTLDKTNTGLSQELKTLNSEIEKARGIFMQFDRKNKELIVEREKIESDIKSAQDKLSKTISDTETKQKEFQNLTNEITVLEARKSNG